ncbi:hypothetical protein EUX98_g3969 [Antrodiella citrinella]|uniref:Survival protein SurE-like phosphatase/nucleotidase domain-containing protein n=1 Tax=Antrodiella citrinella TaxID=2447956 RepID=A0A4S4N398_9APHY|nr:hypothetical protein EUX98_g3969 [Antrodiella citrinella]
MFVRVLAALYLVVSVAGISIGPINIGFPGPGPAVKNIILTNDDGWATAMMRAQMDALIAEGYNVVMSAPSENQSGTSSKSAPPTVLNITCEFGTCDVGSPAVGTNASNTRINYVNSFPVNAVQYGLSTLAPKFFNGKPDFVVSGPNVGTNLLGDVMNSGTIGAACEAAKQGIPAVAFSGSNLSQIAYTTLLSDPTSIDSRASFLNSKLTTTFLHTLFASPARPILPANITLNVNFSPITQCTSAFDYKFVLTRVEPIGQGGAVAGQDVQTCGTTTLPDESTVSHSGGCFVTVSVIDAVNKVDVDAKTQAFVLNRIGQLLSCFTGA